jgi:AcrR family transcriptional regulator
MPDPSRRPARREAARESTLECLADYLLREGLAGASLRPMAAAAGTSDRMLLYYFANRDELLAATLERVAARLAAMLDVDLQAARATPRLPYPALLAHVWAAVQGDALRPYLRLWLDVAARAARGEEPYRAVGGRIADGFLAWASARLAVQHEEERQPTAALLLATVDGAALLSAVGRHGAAGMAVRAAAGPAAAASGASAAPSAFPTARVTVSREGDHVVRSMSISQFARSDESFRLMPIRARELGTGCAAHWG